MELNMLTRRGRLKVIGWVSGRGLDVVCGILDHRGARGFGTG